MRRIILVLLGVITVIAPLTLSAAQANALPSDPAAVNSASVQTPDAQTLASRAGQHHIVLSPAQCAVLRQRLGKPTASCTIAESSRLTAVSAANGNTEWVGVLQVCAEVDLKGYCNPNKWWVDDVFEVVTSATTLQAWNQGTPSCSANHTSYSWCSYANNGTTQLQEGINFGSGGWVRMDISGRYYYCDMRGPAWTNPIGSLSAGQSDYSCPYVE